MIQSETLFHLSGQTIKGDYVSSYLPEPQQGFYQALSREIIPFLGYEFKIVDYHAGLQTVNHYLRLELDSTDLLVLSLMLTGLSGAKRFGGDLHISERMGENSAAHSLHCPILATEFFRLAGLLSEERQTYPVMKMRMEICLGLLIHDMGEILGELSSLSQRTKNQSLQEMPDIEREIFRITLTEAYRAVASPGSLLSRFYLFLNTMRQEAGIGSGSEGSSDIARVCDVISRYKLQQEQTPLPADSQQRVDRLLRLYDMAELKGTRGSPYAEFIGSAVKVIEHIQGTRHKIRFAEIDPSDTRLNISFTGRLPSMARPAQTSEHEEPMISYRVASNFSTRMGAAYMHSGLRQMCVSASNSNEVALANVIRNKAYETIAEWLSVTRPIFNRTVTQEDPFLVTLQSMLARERQPEHRLRHLKTIDQYCRFQLTQDEQAHQKACTETTPGASPFLTRQEMIGLYITARDIGYIPESDTPFLVQIPEELQSYTSFDYDQLLRQHAQSYDVELDKASMPPNSR